MAFSFSEISIMSRFVEKRLLNIIGNIYKKNSLEVFNFLFFIYLIDFLLKKNAIKFIIIENLTKKESAKNRLKFSQP